MKDFIKSIGLASMVVIFIVLINGCTIIIDQRIRPNQPIGPLKGPFSSYPFVGGMNWPDFFPIVTTVGGDANKNINWYSLKELMSNNINWNDVNGILPGPSINWESVRVFGSSHGGDHSGINWQSFGV